MSLIIAMEPVQCKLEVQGKINEVVMSINILGIIITSSEDLSVEVRDQV